MASLIFPIAGEGSRFGGIFKPFKIIEELNLGELRG